MIDPATGGAFGMGLAIGKEIGKGVLAPAAKELGEPLRLAVRRLVAPLVKRFENQPEETERFWERVVEKLRARGVDEGTLREPAEEVVAQALFGNMLVGGQPDLRAMFAGLLASELDSTRPRAHPAFAEVLRQLSGVEARMISCLAGRPHSDPLLGGREAFGIVGLPDDLTEATAILRLGPDLAPLFAAREPGDVTQSLDNLMRLQVATITNQPGLSAVRVLMLSRFGQALCKACT